MRYSLLLLVVLLLLSLGIRYVVDPERISENPAKDLHEMELHDPDLAEALKKADAGDIADLSDWINRADLITREHLATLMWTMVMDPKNPHKPEATLSWKYRNRFRPFLEISTGNEHLDDEIDNNLAYILVTGTAAPSEADIRLVKSLEPRLKHKAKDTNDATIEDTIGCIDFVDRRFEQAKEDFQTSLTYLTQNHDPGTADLEALEKRRMEASDYNAQLVAKHPEPGAQADLKPLPPEPDSDVHGDAHASTASTAPAAGSPDRDAATPATPSAAAPEPASATAPGATDAAPAATPAPAASPPAPHDATPAHGKGEDSTSL
jgi:hypothetical protein